MRKAGFLSLSSTAFLTCKCDSAVTLPFWQVINVKPDFLVWGECTKGKEKFLLVPELLELDGLLSFPTLCHVLF